MAEVKRLGVGETDHRRGVKARADDESFGQVLAGALAGQERGRVVCRRSRGVASGSDEIVLRLGRIGGAPICMGRGDDLSPFAIEIDQLLGDGAALCGVGVQQRRRTAAAQNGSKLPSQIERVLHRDVHALPRFGAVGVAGIAGNEHARDAPRDILLRHVVEFVGEPLADLIDGPPGNFLCVELVRMQDPLRLRNELIERDMAVCDPFAGVELGELDVEADQVAAFPRDDENAALVGGLNQRLAANVREVGDREHIHDAPGVVGGIAVEVAPDRGPDDAARAIAANHVAGFDRLDLSLMRGLEPLERDGHPLRAVTAVRCGRNRGHPPLVIRLELRGRSAHEVEIEIMHARLVDDDVRKLRQAVLDVLDPAAADDVRGLPDIRLPERRLVDPACFLQHALAEAEGMEHLHRAASDAVGLAAQHAARLLLDDAGLDVGKRRQLRGKRQPCRAAADDQDIDFLRNGTLRTRGRVTLRRVDDLRIARLKSIQMKLHRRFPSFGRQIFIRPGSPERRVQGRGAILTRPYCSAC